MALDSFAIPPAAWTRRFDAPLRCGGRPSNLSLRAFPLRKMPFIMRRILAGARERRRAGWDSADILLTASSRQAPGPHQGVPLGGIGAGAIGRGWRGDFRRWQRRPGIYHHGVVWADQFSLFVQRPGQPGQAQVLYPGHPADGSLAAWRWDMPAACAVYYALFPRAWTVYEQPLPGIRLACRQLSPVIPHNYVESSFPTAHFLWRIENRDDRPATVGLMFTFQNGMGTANDRAGGHANREFCWRDVSGIELRHVHRQAQAHSLSQQATGQHVFEDLLAYAVAARAGEGVEVSHCARFDPAGHGAEVWGEFARHGRLERAAGERPAATGETIAAAVAATVAIPARGRREVAFALAWDWPVVRSGFGAPYHPRYTRFYGQDGDAAVRLTHDTLRQAGEWEAQIVAWQQPILDDPGLPGWYKMALFNELYYIVDGGALWVYPASVTLSGSSSQPAPPEESSEASRPGERGSFAALRMTDAAPGTTHPGSVTLSGSGSQPTPPEESSEASRPGERGSFAALRMTGPAPGTTHPGSVTLSGSGSQPTPPEESSEASRPGERGSFAALRMTEADDLGHFAYLEGHEYRMFNTYDVHFYASFALAMLWPQLELALQRDIAAATLAENSQQAPIAWSGKLARRKVAGAAPHDLGWPDEDPWRLVNGYFLHDVNQWKDLNPKFVLQVYRDYVITGDGQFVADLWPAVEAAMAYAARFDRDGDGLIENDGEPDQTYDTWPASGPSAYTGGLWLASLSAAAALAGLLGKAELAGQYRGALSRGQAAYRERLWNGRYFDYDSSANQRHDSIMADQLAGQWYAAACGLPPIVEPAQARSALATIYQHNVLGFQGGSLGAVNGMRPDGKVDATSMQSQEVWTGTTYALAAAMLHAGLAEQAFKTAEGIVRTTYERKGYWFQTPEAWDRKGNYRAIAYMRPLAIWAMQWAWERTRSDSKVGDG